MNGRDGNTREPFKLLKPFEPFELLLEAAVVGVLIDHSLGSEDVNLDAAVLLAACSGAVVGNWLVVRAAFLREAGRSDTIRLEDLRNGLGTLERELLVDGS
jgi:hypothetical protein